MMISIQFFRCITTFLAGITLLSAQAFPLHGLATKKLVVDVKTSLTGQIKNVETSIDNHIRQLHRLNNKVDQLQRQYESLQKTYQDMPTLFQTLQRRLLYLEEKSISRSNSRHRDQLMRQVSNHSNHLGLAGTK